MDWHRNRRARGGGGADVLCGTSSNDEFYGEKGDDTLWGGGSSSASSETLNAGVGTDECGGPFANCTNHESIIFAKPTAFP